MSVTLTLHTQPEVPLEAECLSPDRLATLDQAGIAALPVLHGNRNMTVGDFFSVDGGKDLTVRIIGDLGRVKHVATGMSGGHLIIDGNIGSHLGLGMSGGEITVTGHAGDWVGPEMGGGRIVVRGDAGHMVGSAYRGSKVGMRGGEIIVHGRIGNEAGNGMRRGMIAVAADSGDFTGVNMIAGSIFVLGRLGARSGAGMKRGTIVSLHDAEVLPTYSYAACYHPVFLRHYLLRLRQLGLPVEEAHLGGRYRRWSGDSVELNRGEILLFAG
jgi:formylmethanofuran dehydrogenase subunit C